jgi:hypothetical protein
MALPTFTRVTDGVDDVLAAHVNDGYDVMEALAIDATRAAYANTLSMTSDLAFSDTDLPVQFLDPGGANRIVTLPAEANTNHKFVISNQADANEQITVQDDAAVIIDVVEWGVSKSFVSNGVSWESVEKDTKAILVQVLDGATALTTGDGKAYIPVPPELSGYDIFWAGAQVITTSSSGTPTVQIARGRQAASTDNFTYADVLSTRVTIDAGEYDSKDAAAPPVVNTSNDDLLTGDVLRIDVDVAGTSVTGLNVRIQCRRP